MARDVVELVQDYLSDDPAKWGKLSSNIQSRRLELLLLREIVLELRKLNAKMPEALTPAPLPSGEGKGTLPPPGEG